MVFPEMQLKCSQNTYVWRGLPIGARVYHRQVPARKMKIQICLFIPSVSGGGNDLDEHK